ncbi:hypothetical protein BD779DRAFT_1667985 [Infundibulicybe gibba]|nr:hypothetical protein BD779DRAFT_1667985 [Infundibulicybe gibba]
MPDTPTNRHPPSPLPTVPPHATRRGAALIHRRTRHVGQEHSRAESAEEDDEFQPASNTSAGDADSTFSNDDNAYPTPAPAINANRMGTLLPSACFPIIPHQPIARDAIISNSLTPTAPTHADPPPHPATREIICQYRLSLALALGRNVCMPIPPLAASESTLYSVLTSMGAPCTSLAFI